MTDRQAMFIYFRALALHQQAREKPRCARVARAWMCRAGKRVAGYGYICLADRIDQLERTII